MQSDPPTTPAADAPEKPFSPGAGCMIPIAIVLIVTLFIGFAGYSFFKQNAAIEKFTTDTPLEILPAAPDPAVVERLNEFPIRLTVADLNALLATVPELDAIKEMIRADSIADGQVTATISFPMNKPFSETPRYLNGTLTFIPKVTNGDFFLESTGIQVPGKEIDEGFSAGFRHNRYLDNLLLAPFDEDPELWAKITGVKSATIEGDTIVLGNTPLEGESEGK